MCEQSIVGARASVMVYDDIQKKWIPSGSSSGLSKVQIYHHQQNNTFRVVGRKLQDHEVVINCSIIKGLKYNQATATFHQWRDSKFVYGLNFSSQQDAQEFARVMIHALDVLSGRIPPSVPPGQLQPNNNNHVYDEDMGYRTMTREDAAIIQQQQMTTSNSTNLSSTGSVNANNLMQQSPQTPTQQQLNQASQQNSVIMQQQQGHHRTSSAPPAPQPPPISMASGQLGTTASGYAVSQPYHNSSQGSINGSHYASNQMTNVLQQQHSQIDGPQYNQQQQQQQPIYVSSSNQIGNHQVPPPFQYANSNTIYVATSSTGSNNYVNNAYVAQQSQMVSSPSTGGYAVTGLNNGSAVVAVGQQQQQQQQQQPQQQLQTTAPQAPPPPPAFSNFATSNGAPAAPPAPPQMPIVSGGGLQGGAAPPPPPPPPMGGFMASKSDGPDMNSLAAQLQNAKLRRSNQKGTPPPTENSGSSTSSGGSGNYGTIGRSTSTGMASMMDEMAKTLARRRAQAEKKEPDGNDDGQGKQRPWDKSNTLPHKTNSSGATSVNAMNSNNSGPESPRPLRKRFGSANEETILKQVNGDGGNMSIANGNDIENLKAEIMREIRIEINKAKQEIIEVIKSEFNRR